MSTSLGVTKTNCATNCTVGESTTLGILTNTTRCCTTDLCNNSNTIYASKLLISLVFVSLFKLLID